MQVKFYFQMKYNFLKHCRSIDVGIKKILSLWFNLIKNYAMFFFLLFFFFFLEGKRILSYYRI